MFHDSRAKSILLWSIFLLHFTLLAKCSSDTLSDMNDLQPSLSYLSQRKLLNFDEWELKSIDGGLRARINGASKQKYTFPYEHLLTNKPPSGVIMQQVCGDWTSISGDKSVIQIESHAAYLPVMARNEQLFKGLFVSKCIFLWHLIER